MRTDVTMALDQDQFIGHVRWSLSPIRLVVWPLLFRLVPTEPCGRNRGSMPARRWVAWHCSRIMAWSAARQGHQTGRSAVFPNLDLGGVADSMADDPVVEPAVKVAPSGYRV
ncbi:hypothetical protein [Rhodovibrio sodomensis]|nr:hypothetical protein [Rhodovibrio sodomensis]